MPKGVYIRTEEAIKNMSLSHIGKVLPIEQRRKISEGVKKHLPYKIFKSGHIPWNRGLKGTHFSTKTEFKKGMIIPLETRIKMSLSRMGCNAPGWKGGVTPERERIRHSIEYRLWRESVFARDHWNCQNCGYHGDMHAHHIKSFADYPELRFAIDNGITLCIPCHRKLHKQVGVSK
jgi:hypothetical protein